MLLPLASLPAARCCACRFYQLSSEAGYLPSAVSWLADTL